MADQVGLRIRNKDRILQIDGEYQNLELVSKSDYSIPQNSSTGDMWGASVDIAVPSGRSNVTIAISTTASTGVYVVKIGESLFRVYRGVPNDATVVFTAYIFATPIERQSFGLVGLVVRSRLTGQVVYNSNYKYLRILRFAPVDLYMPIDANAPPSQAFFDFPGKTVAIMQCVRPNGRRQNPAGTPQMPISVFGFFGGKMRTNGGSTAIIEHRVIASAIGPTGSSVASQTFGTYMVIDVTGL